MRNVTRGDQSIVHLGEKKRKGEKGKVGGSGEREKGTVSLESETKERKKIF